MFCRKLVKAIALKMVSMPMMQLMPSKQNLTKNQITELTCWIEMKWILTFVMVKTLVPV